MTTHRTRFAMSIALAICAFTTSTLGDEWKITVGETTITLNERAVQTEDAWLEPTGEAARVFRTVDVLHEASFLVDLASDFVVTVDDDGSIHYQGTIQHEGGLALGGRRNSQEVSTLTIGAQQTGGGTQFAVLDLRRGSSHALDLVGAEIRIDSAAGTLFIASSDLRLSPSWAKALNQPNLARESIGSITVRAALQRVGGDNQEADTSLSTELDTPEVTPAGSIGPDVIVGVLHATASWGRNDPEDGSPDISAFSIGTTSCNAGDVELDWIPGGSHLHPEIPQNMFRLKGNRFEQIGQSWIKHGFFALQGSACYPPCDGDFDVDCCRDSRTGSRLGVGCSDPYGASLNGSQTNMGPRSSVNAFTGTFVDAPANFTGFEVIDRRLQVHDADLDPALNAGALYFAESQYVMPDDAQAGNGENNASYRRILVGLDNGMNDSSNPCNGVFSIEQGEYCIKLSGQFQTQQREPGIRAWKDHDPEVMETDIRIPGEGLFLLSAKAIDLDNGSWEYEYALQNLNSHQSCNSFSLPLPSGTIVGETGFHDVDYHSRRTGGVDYDGTDWPATVTESFISWSTDQFATSPNANALRWGTLYNFRFITNAAPSETAVTLGLFRPGDHTSVTGTTLGPAGVLDCNENGIPDSCDISCEALGCEGECGGSPDCTGNGIPDECEPDCNENGVTDFCDIRDGTSNDCQPNGIPDDCEADCDGDTIPDDCDVPEDCDADGITDCDDFCPCSSPEGSCICPQIDGCCFPALCFLSGTFSRDECFASGGTPDCGDSPCVSGCTLAEIDGDVDRDGDLDLFDSGNFFRCFSGSLSDPNYVKPGAECLARFDHDDNKTIDLTDFQKLQADLTGPLPPQ